MQSSILEVRNLSKWYDIYANPTGRLLSSLNFPSYLTPFVNRTYHRCHALNDISLDIKLGECVGILGKNGSGKSTFLQLVMGSLNPSCGEIFCRGSVTGLLELGSGFNPEYSGLENIYLNCALNGLSRSQTNLLIDSIIDFADIGSYIDFPVKTYSSGMALRLAFASQIFVRSDILIIDEALSVGDSKFQLKCFRKMEEVRENGTTIILVSHSPGVVRQFCDRGIVLNSGNLIFDGPSGEATSIYNNILFPKEASSQSNASTSRSYELNQADISSEVTNTELSTRIICPQVSSYGDDSIILRSVKVLGVDLSNARGDERVHFELDYEIVDAGSPLLSSLSDSIFFGIKMVSSTGITVFDVFGTADLNLIVASKSSSVRADIALPALSHGDYFLSFGAAVGAIGSVQPIFSYDDMVKLSVNPEAPIMGLIRPYSQFFFQDGSP